MAGREKKQAQFSQFPAATVTLSAPLSRQPSPAPLPRSQAQVRRAELLGPRQHLRLQAAPARQRRGRRRWGGGIFRAADPHWLSFLSCEVGVRGEGRRGSRRASSCFGLFSVFYRRQPIPYHFYRWQVFSCLSPVHAHSFTPRAIVTQRLKSLFVNNAPRSVCIVRALLAGGCLGLVVFFF